MLETQLDGTLMERWAFDRSNHVLASTVFRNMDLSPFAGTLMGFAADYRTLHPTDARDATVKAALAEVVARYRRAEPVATP